MMLRSLVVTCAGTLGVLGVLILPAHAGREAFHAGPVFPDFGNIVSVDSQLVIPQDVDFRVSFDVDAPAKPGSLNRTLESAARFINMHVEAGVPLENISVAIVVHGRASQDMTTDSFYRAQNEEANANAALISALTSKGVKIYQCGQSAAFFGIEKKHLVPGVTMALSAMTAHALLQQQGYTLNPF